MKANVFTSALVAIFLFAINPLVVKADSDAILYHNVVRSENVISTTYFKGDGKNANLIPFKKKVDTLNELGVCVAKVTYVWDSSTKSWSPLDKKIFMYEGDKLISIDRYAWNDNKNDWESPQRVSYNYTDDGISAK